MPDRRIFALGLLASLLLAACGGATPPASGPTAAKPPTAPAAPTAAATSAPPTATATATSAPATVAATSAPATAAGIPESLTPEGYHVLGRADAPVTLVMYSDFL